jgi:SAM domain (Sterile alpha motif)
MAAMQQIAEWLEKLGMSEYAQRFIENRIDFEILSDLTDQDLEKLGVVLGDRRKMLRAIAKLETATAQRSDAPSALGQVSSKPRSRRRVWVSRGRVRDRRPLQGAGENQEASASRI